MCGITGIINSQANINPAVYIQGMTYAAYSASNLNAGDTLEFTISGTPKATTTNTDAATSNNNTLLIGAAGLGVALILAGEVRHSLA